MHRRRNRQCFSVSALKFSTAGSCEFTLAGGVGDGGVSDGLKQLTLAFVVFFAGELDQAQARLVIGGVLSVHQPQDLWTVADYGRLWQTEYVDTQYGSHLRAIRSAG